ncbi:hypothetical protein [Nocardioides sp.]|uniref:hypothetical protein n=1 Tax=Nocardioides sp. TaxID=35761 RepID=UPI00260860FF|nr:hypothetical protein [Nocardioides sp.]
MSEHPTGSSANAARSPAQESPWVDDPGYPHRIENHVKVYLHLEESSTRPVVAAPDSAPAGTRVYRRDGAGRAQYGTVTGWTTDGTCVFLSFDQGGTYSGPMFRSVYVSETEDGRAGSGALRWAVSSAAVDGYPLDGVEDGHYCDYEGHPPGARPDWDRQHREAADMPLPTAGELLPLLAAALGRKIDGPTVDQLRAASDLIAEHAQWRAQRVAFSAGEADGDFPASAGWHDSDDAGSDLADRAIALLAEVTGQRSHASQPAAPATTSSVPLMRSALNAAPNASSPQPSQDSLPTSQPPSGPTR